MTTTRPQVVCRIYQFFIVLALLMTLGCAPVPTKALADCEHNQPQNESGMVLPDFGFSLSGACNEVPSEVEAATSDKEDELLKDIEKPLDESASDVAITLDGEKQTS
ncbi:MAG: hypothetical protein D3911_01830 [Candidatus Electrothrix sp. AW3_4]|nr:hypothetical protein [Candidatus Electrothrix gigas]